MDTQENQPAKATNQTESFNQNEIAPANSEAFNSITIGSSFDTNDQRKQATQQEVEKKTIPDLGIDFGNNPESVALSGTSKRATSSDAAQNVNPEPSTDKASQSLPQTSVRSLDGKPSVFTRGT